MHTPSRTPQHSTERAKPPAVPKSSFILRHPLLARLITAISLSCANIAGEQPTDNTPVIPPAAGAPDLSGLPLTYPCPFPYHKNRIDGTCGLSVCPFADQSQGKLFDRDEDGECDIDEGFDPVKNQVTDRDPCVCPPAVPDRDCRKYADPNFCLRLDGGVLDLGTDGMRDFAAAYDASGDIQVAQDQRPVADAADSRVAPDATSRDAADAGAAMDSSGAPDTAAPDTAMYALDAAGVLDAGIPADAGAPDTQATDGGVSDIGSGDAADDAASDAALDSQAGQ